jgi:FtsH-binding integral membrane protein
MNPYAPPQTVIESAPDARALFIRRTYSHVAGSLIALALLEAFYLKSGFAQTLTQLVMGGGNMGWLVVLGAFMLVSWVAEKWANSGASISTQYMGLGLYILAESLILAPMIYIATFKSGALGEAAFFTGAIVVAITFAAFTSKTDFSFLGGFLKVAFIIALGVIVASMIFGFNLGVLFSAVMCLIIGASILYTTSNIIHHYQTNQYVGAALALFAGIATLFWYVLRLVMSRD